MSDIADDENFPDELTAIGPDQEFAFQCGPDQPCFNRCCAQLALQLTPYDCLRLSQNLRLSQAEVLRVFASRSLDEATGFPVFLLRMIESPDAPCPFVTPAGCSVYEDRPGACRAYPLGRGARMASDGVAERFFMIREEHCAGFDAGPVHTVRQWFEQPEMAAYNHFNDRYMRLLSMVRASGRPIGARLGGMAGLCLWQTDNFREFLQKMNILSQVDWDGPAHKLAGDDPDAAATALEFGLSWLELVIFGQAPDLRRKA